MYAAQKLYSSLDHQDGGKLLLRLVVGGLLLFHGVVKVLDTGQLGYINSLLDGAGLPNFVAYGVYIGELVAPAFLVLGFYGRLAALVIAGNMLFVIGLAHTGDIFTLNKYGGWAIELQAFFLFAALASALLGSGRYSFKEDFLCNPK